MLPDFRPINCAYRQKIEDVIRCLFHKIKTCGIDKEIRVKIRNYHNFVIIKYKLY